MTGSDHPGHADCGSEVAAYALGALEPAEAEACRRHLETCVACRDELAAFAQVVDALAISTPQYRAPKALRGAVLIALETRRGPETEGNGAFAQRDSSRPGPGPRSRRWWS
jgi:hypothetical protein